MNKKDSINDKKQYFIDAIARFCDKCGTAYVLEDVNILQNTGVTSIIHFSCHSCKSKHIATYVAPLGISNRAAINTDLSVAEIRKFAGKEGVAIEEILDIYKYMKKNSKLVI